MNNKVDANKKGDVLAAGRKPESTWITPEQRGGLDRLNKKP